MRKTQMYQNVIATDLAFIQELSIYGEFIQVPSELFTYVGREKWNDVHQDYAYFFGKNKKPWLYMPFIALFREHWRRVAYADIPFAAKLRLWGVLIGHQASQFALKILLKTAGLLCFGAWRGKLACAIYWRWMRNPNVKVRNEELFFERVIKPQVGWWK